MTETLGEAAWRELGMDYDLAALEGAQGGWFNAVHMHGDDILFDLLATYPVPVLNWHIGEAGPSIAAYRAAGGRKPVLGGLRRTPITQRDVPAIEADIAAHHAIADASGNLIYRLILDSLAEISVASRLRTIGRIGKKTAIEHHARILDAIERHDSDAAREAMREHIQAAGEDMDLASLKSRKSK